MVQRRSSTRPGHTRACLAILTALVGFGPVACERTTKDTDIKFFSVSESKVQFDRIAAGETKAALFVDPRPAKEYAAGHIPGSRNLTLPQVRAKSKPDPKLMEYETLIVYGNNPASATGRGMTKRLIEVGYPKVRFFAGGLEDWGTRNYPLEKPPSPAPVPETTEPKKEPAPPAEK